MANLDPDDYNDAQLVFVSIFFLTLTYVSVGLRVFVRVWIMKSFQLADWLMLVAQVSAIEIDTPTLEVTSLYVRRSSSLYLVASFFEAYIMEWVTMIIVSLCRNGFRT
jgi:hypothetical protein